MRVLAPGCDSAYQPDSDCCRFVHDDTPDDDTLDNDVYRARDHDHDPSHSDQRAAVNDRQSRHDDHG